jgi:hypothetical protein
MEPEATSRHADAEVGKGSPRSPQLSQGRDPTTENSHTIFAGDAIPDPEAGDVENESQPSTPAGC